MRKYDLISVGDCVVDTFIHLEEAKVRWADKDHERGELSMAFGEKIPYESMMVAPAVGNASNVAVGAARLGFDVAMFTAIGSDYAGEQILGVYRKEKVSPEFVR